jgi:hypothetical protein
MIADFLSGPSNGKNSRARATVIELSYVDSWNGQLRFIDSQSRRTLTEEFEFCIPPSSIVPPRDFFHTGDE